MSGGPGILVEAKPVPRVTIARIMGLVVVVAVACAFPRTAGLAGIMLGLPFAAIWTLRRVFGREPRLSELLVVISVLGFVAGLCLPAVPPHGRSPKRPKPVVAPAVLTGGADLTGEAPGTFPATGAPR